MERNVMNGNALWKAKGAPTLQEHKPGDFVQAVQRVLLTAGTIMGSLLLAGVIASPLCAQSYPTKPVRFILPFPPGGATDLLGRIIGQKLSDGLGQQVVPENRGGSGGNIGSEIAAKAKPDGYTLLLGTMGLAISPGLYKKLNYDPIKDLEPISLTAQSPVAVLARPSLPVKNLRELVDYAKTNPGKINFGSSGIGSANHLAGELLKSLAKINIVHVPYKGAGPALIGVMGGEIDIMVTAISAPLPQIQAGKLRALAVLSHERVPSLPNVPTAKEAGIDNFEVSNWYGILAPGGTPRDIVTRLNAEWIKSAAKPDTQEQLQKAGVSTLSGTPERFAEFIKAEIVRWTKVIREANISSID